MHRDNGKKSRTFKQNTRGSISGNISRTPRKEIKTISDNSTILKKNANGYDYKYTNLSQIHKYLESQNITYYQYIETDTRGNDFVYTVPIINGEEKPARKGARIVGYKLQGKSNPAQEQGSAITYARRYSLLLAFGLATVDDDAESLTETRQQQQQYKAQAKRPNTNKKTSEEILGLARFKELSDIVKDTETIKSILKANGLKNSEDLGMLPEVEYTKIKKKFESTILAEEKKA